MRAEKASFAPDIESLLGDLPDPFAGIDTRWVAWRLDTRDGKQAKVPYNPVTGRMAKATDPRTWAGRRAAESRSGDLLAGGKTGGVGIVLGNLDDGFYLCGIDLDGCRDPATGELGKWASDIIARFASYAEVSPSQTGVKVFFRLSAGDIFKARAALGGKPGRGWKRGSHFGIEAYVGDRYFTVTDDALPGYGEITTVPVARLEWLAVKADKWNGAEAEGEKPIGGAGKSERDESGSGYGYRFFLHQARNDATEDEALEAIREDDGEAGEWAGRATDRELVRTWERAFAKVERDRASARLGTLDLDDEERDILGLSPLDPVTRRLNALHAVVRHGGKTFIVDRRAGGIELGPVSDIHALYANDLVPKRGDPKKAQAASHHWMTDPFRRTYDGVVFDPSGRAPKTALNLFTGWAIEPDRDASCERIVAHVRDVWAAGDPDHARYILGFLADLFQNPGRKPDVALVLKGAKGAGKDIIVEVLKRIIGSRHVAHVDQADRLTGRFNAHFATAILGHVEEAFWGGDRKNAGVLQSLITAPTMNLEKKGIDSITVPSFVRFIMTTNMDWAIPATHDERRYAVFDVSNHRRGDRAYFEALRSEIDNGGAEAFLAFLADHDLDGFDPRDVPQTEALRDQKLSGLKNVARFVFDMLHDAEEDGDDTWEIEIERKHLHARYVEFMKATRFQGDVVNAAAFGRELREIIPAIGERRPRVEGTPGPRCHTFPSLSECRASFEKWIEHPVEWGVSDE